MRYLSFGWDLHAPCTRAWRYQFPENYCPEHKGTRTPLGSRRPQMLSTQSTISLTSNKSRPPTIPATQSPSLRTFFSRHMTHNLPTLLLIEKYSSIQSTESIQLSSISSISTIEAHGLYLASSNWCWAGCADWIRRSRPFDSAGGERAKHHYPSSPLSSILLSINALCLRACRSPPLNTASDSNAR